MRTRIVAYKPFGAKLPSLPDPLQVQVVTPLGELSTAEVQYPRQGVGAAGLDGAVELGFEYFTGSAWVEPPNCRFLSMRGGFDHLEATPTRKYSFVSVGWMLRGARVWDATGLPTDEDGKAQFLSSSAGRIMSTLIYNAQQRGWGAGVSIDFTSTTDSAGKPWAKVLTIAYDMDLDLDAILANLYQQGVCDYRWEGRKLRIFNPDTTMGRDLTLGASPTRLVVADGQTAAPEDWTNEDLLTDAMVLGDGGRRWNFQNVSARPFGRLEKVITQGGVSDPGTAALLADQDLVRGSATRMSYTREFAVTDSMAKAPFRDYLPGDWVQAQRGTGFERLRTQSLSLTVTGSEVKGHAVLGDRLEDLLTKLAKRQKGISGGAVTGGSGVKPAPAGPDVAIPAAPTGLVVAPDAYIDNAGNARGVVALNWAHSGKNVGGAVTGIDRFNVEYRVNELGKPWLFMTSTPDKDAAYSPLALFKGDGVTPQQYGFRVQARGSNGRLGAFSAVTAVEMQPDTTPPPVPYFAAADVTTWLRTITVRWRGKGTLTGTDQVAMPRDFDYINVYQASSASMLGKVMVGQIRSAGLWQSGSMPLATVYYALTAVDRSGNESALSVARAITPTARVDVQEIIDKIDAAEIALTNVGESSILTGAVIARHITASESMTAKMAQFLNVKANQIDTNSIWADAAWIGAARINVLTANSVTAAILKGDAVDGKTITGAIFQTNNSVPTKGGIRIDSAGIRAFTPNGAGTFNLETATGDVTAYNGKFFASTFTGGVIQTSATDNRGVKMSGQGIRGYNTAGTVTVKIDVYGEDNILTGTLRSAPFGQQSVVIFNNTTAGAPAVFLTQGGAAGGNEAAFLLDSNYAVLRSYATSSFDYGVVAQGKFKVVSRESATGLGVLDVVPGKFANDTGAVTVRGSFYVSGSKNFRMPHPDKPGMDLLHGVTESPVSGIEYWGDATIDADGTALVVLPDYFESLAKSRNRAVYAAGNGAAVQWGPIIDGAFTVTGEPGVTFSWLVKAERFGGDFDIEQPTELPLEGETNDA